MTSRSLSAFFAIAAVLGLARGAWAEDEPGSVKTAPSEKADTPKGKADTAKVKTEKATLGGGCFWCLEAVFERVPGVKTVVSGYAGGSVPRPSYEEVSTGETGHAEVVQIEFDPATVSFEKLLKVFFACHDPTTLNAQGPDFGTQYRSIILFRDDAQKQTALKVYKELTASGAFGSPIVTQLVPMMAFYPADRHHQDYYRKNKNAMYCQMYITPKLKKLHLIK